MNKELSVEQIEQVVAAHAGTHADMMRRQRYYEGRHDILQEAGYNADGTRKNRIVTNWCRYIVNQHTGFLTDKPFQYTPRDPDADRAAINAFAAVYAANDLDTVDAEHIRTALVMGSSVEVHSFVDGRIVITQHDPREWSFIFDEADRLTAAIRCVTLPAHTVHAGRLLQEPLRLWTVYDGAAIREYRQVRKNDALTWRLTHSTPHAYGRPPVVLFSVSKDRQAFLDDALLTQQDAYNRVRSANADDVEYNADALLVVKGYDANNVLEVIDELKRNRVLPLDADGSADFITKGNEVNKVTADLALTRDAVHTMGASPDISSIVGATGTTSGIALRLKFIVMMQQAGVFVKYLKKGLRERIDLVNLMHAKLQRPVLTGYDMTITQSLPINEPEIWREIRNLDGLVDPLTQLRMIPSIENPEGVFEAGRAAQD